MISPKRNKITVNYFFGFALCSAFRISNLRLKDNLICPVGRKYFWAEAPPLVQNALEALFILNAQVRLL